MNIENKRICPSCKCNIYYRTTGHRNNAEKHNKVCRKCGYKSGKWKLEPNTKCQICKKPIYRIPSRLKDGTHFCSYSCRNTFFSKEKSFVWKGGPPYYKSREYDKIRRNTHKQKAICSMGGKCSKCGYDKCPASLDFHHINPLEKDSTIKSLMDKSWKKIEKELTKCILLCSNCHREYHWKEKHA